MIEGNDMSGVPGMGKYTEYDSCHGNTEIQKVKLPLTPFPQPYHLSDSGFPYFHFFHSSFLFLLSSSSSFLYTGWLTILFLFYSSSKELVTVPSFSFFLLNFLSFSCIRVSYNFLSL
jgi:hypothetical protein